MAEPICIKPRYCTPISTVPCLTYCQILYLMQIGYRALFLFCILPIYYRTVYLSIMGTCMKAKSFVPSVFCLTGHLKTPFPKGTDVAAVPFLPQKIPSFLLLWTSIAFPCIVRASRLSSSLPGFESSLSEGEEKQNIEHCFSSYRGIHYLKEQNTIFGSICVCFLWCLARTTIPIFIIISCQHDVIIAV